MSKTNSPKIPNPRIDSRKGERRNGFSLIELLIAMAVVLILVGGLVIAGERSLQASRETSAAQSTQSFAADETVYQRAWGGYSLTAENLGGQGAATPAVCTADQEIAIPTGADYETGVVIGGYTLKYTVGAANQFNASGTCAQKVGATYDFTANPVNPVTKSFCSDNTGSYYLPAGTAMANTGIGCLADNTAALPIGQ